MRLPGSKYTAVYLTLTQPSPVTNFGGNKVQPRQVDSFRIKNNWVVLLFRRVTISGSIHVNIAQYTTAVAAGHGFLHSKMFAVFEKTAKEFKLASLPPLSMAHGKQRPSR